MKVALYGDFRKGLALSKFLDITSVSEPCLTKDKWMMYRDLGGVPKLHYIKGFGKQIKVQIAEVKKASVDKMVETFKLAPHKVKLSNGESHTMFFQRGVDVCPSIIEKGMVDE